MSNHLGSYMLNDVLKSALKLGIFEKLEKDTTRAFLKEIFIICVDYDCNHGEILEDIAEDFEICYCCLEYDKPLRDGLCQKCGNWKD